MKKRIYFVSAVVLLFGIVASFVFLNLRNSSNGNNKEETSLSAEYAYAHIFFKANFILNNLNEEGYADLDKARFKTNFLLAQIDLKSMKKEVEKCLLDNGISYDRADDEVLIEKCEQPFFEKIFNLSKNVSVTEKRLAEAFFAHHLAQLPLKSNEALKEKGYSESAVVMAPVIAYTRIDVHECVKKAVVCFTQDKPDDKDATIEYCLEPCNAEYARALESVLKDYEYRVVR